MRDTIGITVCLATAMWGALAVVRGWHVSLAAVALYVGAAWTLVGDWLGGRFTREGRKAYRLPLTGIYKGFRSGALQRPKPLVAAIETGGLLLFLVAVVAFFAR